MHMSELQNKEMIDIATGKRIGGIVDIVVDSKGTITKLLLDKRFGKRIINNPKEDIEVTWNQIIKIGDDIILVDLKNKN